MSGPIQDNFILINANNKLYQFSMDGSKRWLDYPTHNGLKDGVLYDPVGEKMYHLDDMELFSSALDGTHLKKVYATGICSVSSCELHCH